MHRRADRYRSIAIVKGYRTVKILWPTDECRKSSRLYKWENRAIFSHFWRNLLAAMPAQKPASSKLILKVLPASAEACQQANSADSADNCIGCLENQPNQQAHMGPGGCLYEDLDLGEDGAATMCIKRDEAANQPLAEDK